MIQDSDAVGVLAGKAATYAGSGSAVIFGMTADMFAAVVGIGIAVIGVGIQWYYNAKRDKRQTEEHKARMAQLLRGVVGRDDEQG